MVTSVLYVEGMSCEHCVAAVNKAARELSGVTEVSVDLAGKTVTVEHDPEKSSVAKIKEAIEDQGYDVVD